MLYSQSLISRRLTLHDDAKTIADQLTVRTCEIEEIHSRTIDKHIVVGRVLSIEDHPNADKLVVCQIDCGEKGEYQICTGATNVIEGGYVPVALPGAHLPALGFSIGVRKMRGVESSGMICAKEELGIAEDVELHGIWRLEDDFPDITDVELGAPFAEAYTRLENTIYDVENKTITHRPDLMGHAGIARELYAIYQQHNPSAIKTHSINQRMNYAKESIDALAHNENKAQDISIQTPNCRAYYAIQLHNIAVRSSTFHTRLQLIDLGLTPKNNRIDFSNLFMYQTGQPIHCFDSDRIQGSIIIRQATEGESFVDLMDGQHTLTPEDIVIADSEKILALAGVIGGKSSAISDATTNITIELANFDPITIRKTAIRHGVRTDASARFEKNIAPLMTQSMLIALRDMMDYMKPDLGTVARTGITSSSIIPLHTATINRSIADLHRIVGQITDTHMEQALHDLGFGYELSKITVPRWRGPADINLQADVAEEVVRIVGYNTLESVSIPTAISHQSQSPQITLQRHIEDVLSMRHGLDSVETYPRAHDDMYELFGVNGAALPSLQNPLQPEQSHLSHSLLYNLLSLITKNHKFYNSLRYYTIGSVRAGESRPYADTWGSIANINQATESRQVGTILYDVKPGTELQHNILSAKHLIADITDDRATYQNTSSEHFHPRQQANILIDGKVVGFVGRLHPIICDALKIASDADLVYLTLDLAALESTITRNSQLATRNYYTLQDHILLRDVSFVLDRSETFESLITAIRETEHVTDVTVFDVYQGEHLPSDKKSIALQLSIYHPDNNLTSEQINEILEKAIAAGQNTGAVLRKDFNK